MYYDGKNLEIGEMYSGTTDHDLANSKNFENRKTRNRFSTREVERPLHIK